MQELEQGTARPPASDTDDDPSPPTSPSTSTDTGTGTDRRTQATSSTVRGRKKADKPLRVSTTDPGSRVMKMADGGFRPAWNVQFAVDVDSGLTVAVDLVNQGSDMRLMTPMYEQVCTRYAHVPGTWLVDGGFVNLAAIEALEQGGTEVLAPPPTPRTDGIDRYARKPKDSDAIGAWRMRMGTESAHERYRLRAATVECANAHARGRGFTHFEVVGPAKARCVALWHALAELVGRTTAATRARQDRIVA